MKNLVEFLKARVKNYGFWVSFFAMIPLIFQMFTNYELPDSYANLTNAVLTFIVAAGLVNNPTTDSKWFLDDK